MLYDAVWQIGGSIVNRASYFITQFLLSGILSPASYGIFGLIYNVTGSISSVTSTSLGIVTRRELVKKEVEAAGNSIMAGNVLWIGVACVLISGFALFAEGSGNAELSGAALFLLIFLFSVNVSVSHYLNYHFSGLGKFAAYNKLLLPINILLPVIVYLLSPQDVATSVLLITAVTMAGNLVQMGSLLREGRVGKLTFRFQREHARRFVPCFLQSVVGLPVVTVLQIVIATRWDNLALIGLITLSTQVLNMSNIFASKLLTVFSPRISRLYFGEKAVPLKYVSKLFATYVAVITCVSLLLVAVLPILISVFKSNFHDSIYEISYFIIANIVSSSVWFFTEYFHSVQKSWISFWMNVLSSVTLFVLFFSVYFSRSTFDLISYANCIALSRVVTLVVCVLLIFRYGEIGKNPV